MLSVVIPTHSKRALLQRTLAALDAQELPAGTEWEIVVVNDGSPTTPAPGSSRREHSPAHGCGW